MKVRNGFVTNSSSSSFIIGIDGETPDSVKPYVTILDKDVDKLLDFFMEDAHVDVDYTYLEVNNEEVNENLGLNERTRKMLALAGENTDNFNLFMEVYSYMLTNPNNDVVFALFSMGDEPPEFLKLAKENDLIDSDQR